MSDNHIETPLGQAKITFAEMLIVICALEMYPKVLSHESLHAFYEFNLNQQRSVEMGDPYNTISVMLTKLRKRVSPLGVFIETCWGRGYIARLEFPK